MQSRWWSRIGYGSRAVTDVSSVHDLHIWSLTSGKSSLTAHVVHEPEHAQSWRQLAELLAHLVSGMAVFAQVGVGADRKLSHL